MKHKPLIAVVGATGAQGGGLARAILDDPDRRFAVRAITRHVDAEKALGLAAHGAEDLGNMFQFNRDFEGEFCAARDLALSRELNPRLQTFAQWLADHARRIPLDG